MRITGGRARGIPLQAGRARHVRPATDRLREAVFSSLAERVVGARVLDLFAGSGSYGLEAASRGAGEVLFVEKHPLAVRAIEAHILAVRKSIGKGVPPMRCIRRDVLRFQTNLTFTLVFMDPPYELARTHEQTLFERVEPLLEADGLLLFEAPGDLEVSGSGWTLLRRLGKDGVNEPSINLLQREA